MPPRTETIQRVAEAERRGASAGLAGLLFALAAPATYFAERLLEHARGEAGDPRLVLATLHTVYYWRLAVAVWWGGVVAALAVALLTPSARVVRATCLMALVMLPVLVALAVRFP